MAVAARMIGAFLAWLGSFTAALAMTLGAIGPTFLFAFALLFALWQLDQAQEVYVFLAVDIIEDWAATSGTLWERLTADDTLFNVARLGLSVVCWTFGSLMLWFFARTNYARFEVERIARLRTICPEGEPNDPLAGSAVYEWFRLWAPRLVGLAPAIGLAAGMVRTLTAKTVAEYVEGGVGIEDYRTEVMVVIGMAIMCSAVAISVLTVIFLRHSFARKEDDPLRLPGWRFAIRIMMPFVVAGVAYVALNQWVDVILGPLPDDVAVKGLPTAYRIAGERMLFGAYGWYLVVTAFQLLQFDSAVRMAPSGRGSILQFWRMPFPIYVVVGALGLWVWHRAPALVRDDPTEGFAYLTALSLLILFAIVAAVGFSMHNSPARNRIPRLSDTMKAGTFIHGFGFTRAMEGKRKGQLIFVLGWGGGALIISILFGVLLLIFDDMFAAEQNFTISQLIGPVGMLGLFIAGFAGSVSYVSHLARRNRLPIITVLFLIFVSFSALDLNEQHWTRGAEPSGATPPPPLDAGTAFDSWARARGIAEDDRVFLVAAQGGGLYAAYHTALFLSEIQDETIAIAGDAIFSDRLFAVSGVSGGSVGAAVFGALQDHCKPDRDDQGKLVTPVPETCRDYADRADRIVNHDYLTPLLARMLFADIGADFLVDLPWFGSWFDRSRPQEDLLSSAFDHVAYGDDRAGGFLDRSIVESWRHDDRDGPPVMMLNAADVSTGRRLVLTPFSTFYPRDAFRREDAPTTFLEAKCHLRQMRETPSMTREQAALACNPNVVAETEDAFAPAVKTSAFLSARFPIVAPPGRIRFAETDTEGVHVIDGGSFDNTGLATIADLIHAIHSFEGREDQKIGVIVLAFREPPRPPAFGGGHISFGEIVSPAATFFASWRARGLQSKDLLERLVNNQDEDNRKVAIYRNDLQATNARGYTLSWLLSQRTMKRIRQTVNNPQCPDEFGEAQLQTCKRNRRVVKQIIRGVVE